MSSYVFLRECFTYDPSSGVLFWKSRPRSHFANDRAWHVFLSRDAGNVAGSLSKIGYLTVRINGKSFYVHRVAWEIVNGPIPRHMQIDHIDGNKIHNRLENLRLATRGQNAMNAILRRGKQLPKGVHFDKNRRKYMAYISSHGTHYHLGRFNDVASAEKAVRKKRTELHGEFCHHGESR